MLQQRLKKLTAPLHTAIEKTAIARALLSQALSVDDYVAYLNTMAGIHLAIESQFTVFESTALLSPLVARQRLDLIRADVLVLTHQAPELLAAASLSEMSVPSLLGALYVLEGSTLGGQVIAKRLTHLQTAMQQPVTAYLSAYGNQTMAQWQAFCQILNQFDSSSPEVADDVILGAMQTFTAIYEGLSQLEVPLS